MAQASKAAGSQQGTQAIDRAAALLATVVRADAPLPYTELLDECGLPKSTTSRLMNALERTDLVERDDSGSYVAGPLFWLYAAQQDPWEEFARLAQPVLTSVGEDTKETVHLAVPRADHVVQIAQVDSEYLLGSRDWSDIDVPPHTSALGKVLYAFRCLPRPTGRLERRTAATTTRAADLNAELGTIRKRGWAEAIDELEEGLAAIAVPVRRHDGEVIAALGVSGPTSRLEDQAEEIATQLRRRSDQLTRRLSGRRREEDDSESDSGAA